MPDHVDYHEDHLFLLVDDLVEVKGWQVQFHVGLEDVLVGGQRVDHVPVVLMRVLVHFHARCATAHSSSPSSVPSQMSLLIYNFNSFLAL